MTESACDLMAHGGVRVGLDIGGTPTRRLETCTRHLHLPTVVRWPGLEASNALVECGSEQLLCFDSGLRLSST